MHAVKLPRSPLPTIVLFVVSAVALFGFHNLAIGWGALGLTALDTIRLERDNRLMLLSICLAIAIIGTTPVNTGLSTGHILKMLAGMIAAVAVPYLFLEHWHKQGVIQYKLHHGRRWHLYEILYVLVPAAIGYFTLPFFFSSTGNYQHWTVELTFRGLLLLLLGLIAVGVWDEVIFVATIGSVLRKLLPFWAANIAQAFVFSSFLYELGFRSWSVYFAYIFALIQFYIYKITNSLIYAITIHVVFDLVLFVALIHAYYPQYLRIFITH